MKKLEVKLKKNGLNYTLLERTDKVALYNVGLFTYEVFDIPLQKAATRIMPGGRKVVYEAGERLPSNEEFGIKYRSKALISKERAYQYYNFLNTNPPN